MEYKNPVIPGFHPDPSICRKGEDYYLVTSSFEYYPGVPIFHSRNLVNWEQVGYCLSRSSQLPLSGSGISDGIFAPTLRYHDGLFYMVTTNISNGGHFYVTAEDPAGEWSDPIWIDAKGIDPDLFWDSDGKVYFSSDGDKAILQREVDLKTGKIISETHRVEAHNGGAYPEAPHVYKIGQWYYLLMAEGGTEYAHSVTIARGPSPLGPWETCPHNPILTHRGIDSPIQATGHGDLIQDHLGQWWMLCLGIRPSGYPRYHLLGRETFLAPVHWKDGWPVVGNQGNIAIKMEGHGGLSKPSTQELSTYDDFDSDSLALHWNFICNPDNDSWKLENSGLWLKCKENTLHSTEGQSWIGRRQQNHTFHASSRILFQPELECEEAGLTVYQNINHHYEIGIGKKGEKSILFVRRTIGSLSSIDTSVECHSTDVELFIKGNSQSYQFGYLDQGNPVILSSGESRYLGTEIGGKFTGIYLAMYASSNKRASNNGALFKSFSYKAVDTV